MTDSLATAASMVKIPTHSSKKYSFHVKHHPIVPDNLRYWQVFLDGKHINNLLQTKDEFLNSHIDDTCDEDDQEIEAIEVEVWEFKDNNIPRGLVPSEELFYHDDVATKPTMVPI